MIIERLVGWMDTAPVEQRAKAANALVRAWHLSELSDDERDAAEAAMTCILDDQDTEVRLSLAEALSDIADAPRHLVLALAGDESEVSAPILSSSSSLLDIELLHYVKSGSDEQQMAIASRPWLSPEVCKAIASTACKAACLVLVTNSDAKLTEDDFFAIAQRFGDWTELRKCLLVRHDIGMRTRVLLIEFYAATLIELDEHADEKLKARKEKELCEVCEKATITFAAQITDQEISELVQALIERQKLTTVFLLRAICMGNLSLFAHALAILAEQPLGRVERILKDNRINAMHALCSRAGLPLSALSVFSSAIVYWRKYLEADIAFAPEQLPYLVTKEILSTYEGKRDEIVDELLMLLRRICTETARENARSKVNELALEASRLEALPAPEEEQKEIEFELSEEETLSFMLELADNLADMAIQDEMDNRQVVQELVPANEEVQLSDRDKAFQKALELPPIETLNQAA